MGSTTLTIPATTSPFAALLAGYGLAQWLHDLAEQVTGETVRVRVAASGVGVTVTADRAIDPTRATAAHYQNPLSLWILTAKNGPAPAEVPSFDYEHYRQRNTAYFAERARLAKAGGRLTETQELKALAPPPEWPVAALVNQMGGIGSYNKAVERWRDCKDAYPDLVALIWTMGSGTPDALERAERAWGEMAKAHGVEKNPALPATQIVNPDQGKGANRAKADALTIGGRESFWLLEYFKFAGLYAAALPRTVRERKDRKTYVVVPTQVGTEWHWHEQVFTAFQKGFWASSAIKMDILAALSYTDVMLTHWEGAQASGGRRRRVSDYSEGFAVASYKDLGSAVAVMNVATVGLPDWVAWPKTPAESQGLRAVIENHRRMINALDEAKSDEEQLLRDYRDFLSSRDPALRSFFAFTTGYAGHLLQTMGKGRPTYRLTTENLEVIVMAQEESRAQKLKPILPILESPGFQRIATAIRQSTVTPQYYKSKPKESDNTYDVRYGLAHDLHRASRDDGTFVQVLSAFIAEYCQENARVMERMAQRGKSYRKRIAITTEDIAQVVALVDDYHAPTVAGLLIAFGYARDPRANDDRGAGERTEALSDDSEADETPSAVDEVDPDNPF